VYLLGKLLLLTLRTQDTIPLGLSDLKQPLSQVKRISIDANMAEGISLDSKKLTRKRYHGYV